MVKIDIDANCEGEGQTQNHTGTYKAIGGFGDYAFYENQTPDTNGNRWYLYFDTVSNGWTISFQIGASQSTQPGIFDVPSMFFPGDSFLGTTISPFDESEQIQFDLATDKFECTGKKLYR